MQAMNIEEYEQLKAFRDLIHNTAEGLRYANGQGALAAAADAAAERWAEVDADFARVLRDIRSQAWSMPLAQIKPVVQAVVEHLEAQLAEIDRQLSA